MNSQSHWKQGSQENELMFHWSPTSSIAASLNSYTHDWRCKTRDICKNKEERCSLLSSTSELRRPKCLSNLKNSNRLRATNTNGNAYISFKWLIYYIESYFQFCFIFSLLFPHFLENSILLTTKLKHWINNNIFRWQFISWLI